ncbi:MAG: MerR family transcriptional regulator [Chloroflexi bacterium]|nr:MAG: MerR family transcriptional regulator [Chloroflexota bacterium]
MPRYVISVASKLVGVPPHTLRSYEQADLITPARTEGNVRLYSDADIDILRRIVELSEQGVNLAGIKIILQMEGLISGNGTDAESEDT